MRHFKSCRVNSGCACEIKDYSILLAIGLLTILVEGVAVFFSESIALMGDALHVAFDNAGHTVSIFVAFLVMKGGSAIRVRKIGGYISASLLLVASGVIIVESVRRFSVPREILSWPMLVGAFLGLIGNEWQHRRLKKMAVNVTSHIAKIHVLSDLWVSRGVLGSAAVISFTGWMRIDPLVSLGIGVWIAILSIMILLGKGGHHHHHGESDHH